MGIASPPPSASQSPQFDVFLSHNGKDKPAVEQLARRLKEAAITSWLDKWELIAGDRFQDQLAAGLRASHACAYFIGPAGEGNWAREELDLARSRSVKDHGFRLFSVLLPGLPEPFDQTTLPPFLTTRTWIDFRKGLDDPDALQAMINAIKGVAPTQKLPATDSEPPYLGLRAFEPDDARYFFGRDADVQQSLEKLKASRFLAIVGPSGSGKSSLARAGIVPALARGALPGSEDWPVEIVKPGSRPLETLALALAARGSGSAMQATVDGLAADARTLHLASKLALPKGVDRFVWVIDQAEEIFTLCHDEAERAAFIENIRYAASLPGGTCIVVFAMRADFYPRCAAYPDLAALISSSQHLVGPLTEDGLRAAIEQPAHAVGLEFEEGLVGAIMDDVERQPGALPLLEHALLELWRRRRGSMLTLEAYREAGGVQGAVAKRAEMIFSAFSPEEQEIARRALMRLSQPGEGTEDTRRRAALSELITQPSEAARVEAVVNELTDARLLTASADDETGATWVDISHEALIRGWPRVRKWLDEGRGSLLIQRRLTDAAQEWQRRGRDESELYRGARLAEAQTWREGHASDLNAMELAYLDASRAAQDREQALVRRRRRASLAAVVLVPLLVVVLVAGFLTKEARDDANAAASNAVTQENNASIQKRLADEATKQRRAAVGAALGFASADNAERPDLAALLAVAAAQRSELVPIKRYLLSLLNAEPQLVKFSRAIDGQAVAASADGSLVAVAANGAIRITPSGNPFGPAAVLVDAPAPVADLAFDRSAGRVAAVGSSGVTIWTLPGTNPSDRVSVDNAERVAFLADGSLLVANTLGEVDLVALGGLSRTIVLAPLNDLPPSFSRPIFSPDGSRVARAEAAHVAVYSLPDGKYVGGSAIPEPTDGPPSFESSLPIAIDATGTRLAANGPAGLLVYDIATEKAIDGMLADRVGGAGQFIGADRIVAMGQRGGLVLIDFGDGRQTTLANPPGSVSMATLASGRVITAHPGYGTGLWDLNRTTSVGEQDPINLPEVSRGLFGVPVTGTADGRIRVSLTFADGTPTVPPDVPTPGASPPVIGPPAQGGGLAGAPGVTTTVATVVVAETGESRSVSFDALPGWIAITPDGDTLLLTDTNSGSWQLVARSAADGAERWRTPISVATDGTPLAVSPDGATVATVEGGRVTLRSLSDGSLIRSLAPIGELSVFAMAFQPDGARIMLAGGQGVAAGPLQPVPPGTIATNQAALMSISSTASDQTPTITTVAGTAVTALAFDPSGALAMATLTFEGGQLALYDPVSFERLGILNSDDVVQFIAFATTDGRLSTVGERRGWMRWALDDRAWQTAACATAVDDLTAAEWNRFIGPSETQAPICPPSSLSSSSLVARRNVSPFPRPLRSGR